MNRQLAQQGRDQVGPGQFDAVVRLPGVIPKHERRRRQSLPNDGERK